MIAESNPLLQPVLHASLLRSTVEYSGLSTESTTLNLRSLRGTLRRMVRKVAFRAIDLGLVGAIANGLSVADRRRGLYLRGRVNGVRRRHDDHTDFWAAASAQFPADSTFLRQKIHAALRAGRISDAEAGLASLLAARGAQAADCNFVLGLAFVYHRRNDGAAVRDLVRKFLKSLRGKPDYRVAAVRLSRLFATYFARCRIGETGGNYDGNRRQFVNMLDRSATHASPKALLTRVVGCEQALAINSPLALFDTDVSPAQCRAFVRFVRSKLAAGEPFSFVRIGDGEAACLPYEPSLSRLRKGDAIERERIWWGEPLTASQRSRMTQQVCDAIWSADCIGIPTVSRFLRELRLTEDDRLDRGLTGRGLRSILFALERYQTFRGAAKAAPAFTSCHLHQDLERWELYPELLEGVGEMAVVSCHPRLGDYVRDRFGATVVANVLLPPDRVSAPVLREQISDRRRLPDIMDEVLSKMDGLPRGRLVLVGAGYLGKWLVNVARARGGIALDVGSVFDYWLGLTTRSYLDLDPRPG